MLKLTTLIFTTLFASISFASTHGGGVLMKNFSMRPNVDLLGGTGGGGVMKSPEIVFHMGQKDGLIKFAYGQLDGNQWQIRKIQIPVEELMHDSSASLAIQKSKSMHKWIPIQN